jgi:hypothetical protein
LPLFIYGTIYGLQLVADPVAAGEWNTLRFAAAGVVPGFVLVNALCLVAVWKARKLPTQPFAFGELARSFVKVLPELFIPVGVLAGLLIFSFSLPEIASLTLVYVIVLQLGVLRTIHPRVLWTVSREAMTMVGAIFVIILCSTVFTNYIVTAEIPGKLVDWATQYVDSKIVFLLALNLLLLVVGMIMDIFSAIVIVLPLIVPISRHYGIDPYHLGIIFLLNLEVGYLTPPVGLNLFITSIKFQTPVDEVLRATLPFLATMVVVLGLVTYIPALTIVPPAERTAPINNLVLVARAGIQESKVSIAEFTLVDQLGKEFLGPDKKPIVRRFVDCEKVTDAFGKPMLDEKTKQPLVPNESQKDVCQSPFYDITECMPNGKSTDPAQLACKHAAISKWIGERYNEDYPAHAIIVVDTVPLAGASGEPLTYEVEMKDKDGKPVLDELEMPKKEEKNIVGPDGKPFVRTLEWCTTLEFKSDQERCRQLFIAASRCKLGPEAPEEDCAAEKCPDEEPAETPGEGSAAGAGSGSADVAAGSAAGSGSADVAAGSAAGAGSGSGSATEAGSGSAAPPPPATRAACLQTAAAACVNEQYASCVAAAAKSWADENPSIARNPKLAGSVAKQGPNEEGKAGGCSKGGAAAGFGFGALLLYLLMRRRQT